MDRTGIFITYFQRRRCSLVTLVSGNIRFMRIFDGGFPNFPGSGASKSDSGVVSTFARYFFRSFRGKVTIIILYSIILSLVSRHLSSKNVHELE